jgi:hypothetical protein
MKLIFWIGIVVLGAVMLYYLSIVYKVSSGNSTKMI